MKRLLMVGGFFTASVVLVGCITNLSAVDQFKTINGNPPLVKNAIGNLVSLGVNSSINPGQSVNGYLNDQNLDGYGDEDWYLLNGVSVGSVITVELTGSSSGDFDLAIWKDGSWVAYDDSLNSSARLNTTAGTTTWIWVGIWSGKGSYTLRVNTTTSGACSGGRLEQPIPAYLSPYIKKACYDSAVWSGAGVQLTLTAEGRRICHETGSWCATFANFVISSKNWKGNRLLRYVTMEIYLHSALHFFNPIHIEYMCEDVSKEERWAYGEIC